jgi:hypothetical protein
MGIASVAKVSITNQLASRARPAMSYNRNVLAMLVALLMKHAGLRTAAVMVLDVVCGGRQVVWVTEW